MDTINQIYSLIKDEIKNDPAGRGYAKKTDQEIADLLNNAYKVDVTVTEQRPSRMSQIIGQIPFLPNAVTSDQVNKAVHS